MVSKVTGVHEHSADLVYGRYFSLAFHLELRVYEVQTGSKRLASTDF
jgi:hypothetical protein